mgnify:FL=1
MLVMLASCVLLAILLPVFDLPIFGGLGRYKIWFLLSYAALCFPSVMGTVARAMDQMKLMLTPQYCLHLLWACLLMC